LKLPLGIPELEPKINSELINTINLVILGSYLFEMNDGLFLNIFLHENNFKENQKDIYFSLLTLAFKDYSAKSGKELRNGSKIIVKDSLKLSNEAIKEIGVVTELIDELSNYVNNENFDRLSAGLIIRKIRRYYLHRLTFISICYDYLKMVKNTISLNTTSISSEPHYGIYEQINEQLINNIVSKYEKWYTFITNENLLDVDELKPILDGVQIQNLLNMKPSRELKFLMDGLIEQQLINPNINESEAVEYLKLKRAELKAQEESQGKTNKKK
jgi:hypothetical protein